MMTRRLRLVAFYSFCLFMTLGCTDVIEDESGAGSSDVVEEENATEDEQQNEPVSFSITGSAQKGPFTKGSYITAFPLDSNLVATGQSFPGTIIDNLGNFKINCECSAPYLELRAEGYYFRETCGAVSDAPLYLEALVPLDSVSINLNVLTTIIKPRVKKLILEGASYDTAISQSQSEFIATLGIDMEADHNFDELSIVDTTDFDALLLAMSCLIEQNRTTGDVSSLIQEIAFDFEDGEISAITQDKINGVIGGVPIDIVTTNLLGYYKANGLTDVNIPEFWKYLMYDGYYSISECRLVHGICIQEDGVLCIVDETMTPEQEEEYAKRYSECHVNFVTGVGTDLWNYRKGYGPMTLELTTFQTDNKSELASDVSWVTVNPVEAIGDYTYMYTITAEPDVEEAQDAANIFWSHDGLSMLQMNKPLDVDVDIFNVLEKPVLVKIRSVTKLPSIVANGIEYPLFEMPKYEWDNSRGYTFITFIPKSEDYKITISVYSDDGSGFTESHTFEQFEGYVINIKSY